MRLKTVLLHPRCIVFSSVFSRVIVRMAAQKIGREYTSRLAAQAERHTMLSVGTPSICVQNGDIYEKHLPEKGPANTYMVHGVKSR